MLNVCSRAVAHTSPRRGRREGGREGGARERWTYGFASTLDSGLVDFPKAFMPPRGGVDLVLVVFLGEFVAHGCLRATWLRGSVKRGKEAG